MAITKCAFWLFPPPALCECRHGSLATLSIAVRGRPVLMLPEGECPHPFNPPGIRPRRGSRHRDVLTLCLVRPAGNE